jgi:hypothetical protein
MFRAPGLSELDQNKVALWLPIVAKPICTLYSLSLILYSVIWRTESRPNTLLLAMRALRQAAAMRCDIG